MTPPIPKPPKRSKRRPVRAGTTSTVAPPGTFRRRVGEDWRWTCVVCGAIGAQEGGYDPAHLIPAQMIRREARTSPALEHYVYDPRLAVWACRGCHFQNDYLGTREPTLTVPVLERCGAWPILLAVVAEMDAEVEKGEPFAAFVERTYTRRM